MNEVDERIDLESPAGNTYRRQNIPHLLLCRRPISLSSFVAYLTSRPSNQQRYPVLWHFIQTLDSLRPLVHLPAIAQWLSFTFAKFNRRITQETAQKTSIADVLHDCQKNRLGSRSELQKAWNEFRQAWNFCTRFQLQLECQVASSSVHTSFCHLCSLSPSPGRCSSSPG